MLMRVSSALDDGPSAGVIGAGAGAPEGPGLFRADYITFRRGRINKFSPEKGARRGI